jgi:hypothetical protein
MPAGAGATPRAAFGVAIGARARSVIARFARCENPSAVAIARAALNLPILPKLPDVMLRAPLMMIV